MEGTKGGTWTTNSARYDLALKPHLRSNYPCYDDYCRRRIAVRASRELTSEIRARPKLSAGLMLQGSNAEARRYVAYIHEHACPSRHIMKPIRQICSDGLDRSFIWIYTSFPGLLRVYRRVVLSGVRQATLTRRHSILS